MKILHLSDIHCNKECMMLNDQYFNSFIRKIKYLNKENKERELEEIETLVISGDLLDRGGHIKQVDSFLEHLQKLQSELELKNILIVPGNHDVFCKWIEEQESLGWPEENGDLYKAPDKFKLYNQIFVRYDKLENAKEDSSFEHRSKFFGEVNMSKCIVSKIVVEREEVILLGLNSVWKQEKSNDHRGYIDNTALRKELEEINREYPKYYKIAIFHHCPTELVTNARTECNCMDAENWKEVKSIFAEYEIEIVLTGHVHGTQVIEQNRGTKFDKRIIYVTAGSFGINFEKDIETRKMGFRNSFTLITLEYGNCNVEKYYSVDIEGEMNWVKIEEQDSKYNINFPKLSETPFGENVSATKELINGFDKEYRYIIDDVKQTEEEIIPIGKIKKDYEIEIKKIIRENKLLKTGHFHWNANKALNWIDTNILLSKYEYINIITDGFIKLFSTELSNAECIVGLGIKGSIIGEYLRYSNVNLKYHSCPEDKLTANSYENRLSRWEEGYKKVIICTDVLHSGETIKKFVKDSKILKKGRKNEIYIFCIVNTKGDSSDIKGLKNEGGYNVDAKICSLCDIAIKNCSNTTCPIYDDNLDTVYKF